MPFTDRPVAPSPGLLDDARRELAGRLSLDPDELQWTVAEQMARKRSTIFPLDLVTTEGRSVSRAFYKAPFFPDADERPRRNLRRTKAALLRSKELGDRFADLAQGSGIATNVTLALDPETFEVVTLGLDGHPMAHPLSYLLTRSRRSSALEACHRVGRAVRLIEGFEVSDTSAVRERIWGETERKLKTASPTLSVEEVEALDRRFTQLLDDAFAQDQPVVTAHGDLSPSNTLIGPNSTGIIDFMWIPQLRGFDLARFAHRLRFTTFGQSRWTGSLVDAMLDGYGDRTVRERPGWRFVALQRALATALRDTRRAGRIPARRAIDQIRSAL